MILNGKILPVENIIGKVICRMLLSSLSIREHFPVRMTHNLAQIPKNPLPAGYSFRSYVPGDEQTWLEIQQAAEPEGSLTAEAFSAEYSCYQPPLSAMQFYVVAPDGKPVGTATAWFCGKTCGLIKGLAVAQAHRGRGLEEAIVAEACRRFRGFEYSRGAIQVGSAQIEWIRALLRAGFCPETTTGRDRAFWGELNGLLAETCQRQPLAKASDWLRSMVGRKHEVAQN
jgi:GNAT superfamily N-acetyltransferase